MYTDILSKPKNRNKIPFSFKAFEILMLCYVFLTSATWFGFNIPMTPMVGTMNVLMVMCLFGFYSKLKFTPTTFLAIGLLVLIGLWFVILKGGVLGIVFMFKLLPAVYLLVLSKEYKYKLLRFCTNWYSIILLFSIIFYLLNLITFVPPFMGMFEAGDGYNYPPFLNFFFYIKPLYTENTFDRFNGFALEPGHLAISTIFFLIANKFDFRGNRYLWILLTGVIISFSLAGYLLLAISWLLIKVTDIRRVILPVCAVGILYFGAQVWNEGDNNLNNLIFSRLTYDAEKGIQGNNRSTENTDYYFDYMVSQGELFTGIKNAENIRIAGAGYKKYLLQYGLISAILMLGYYWSLIPSGANKRYAYSFLFIVFLTFCDCEYPTWFSWLLPYVLGIGTKNYTPSPNSRELKLQSKLSPNQ